MRSLLLNITEPFAEKANGSWGGGLKLSNRSQKKRTFRGKGLNDYLFHQLMVDGIMGKFHVIFYIHLFEYSYTVCKDGTDA